MMRRIVDLTWVPIVLVALGCSPGTETGDPAAETPSSGVANATAGPSDPAQTAGPPDAHSPSDLSASDHSASDHSASDQAASGLASQTDAHHHHGLSATAGPGYTAADVEFMQMMIVHHQQALVMVTKAPTHGAGSAVLGLSQRIEISQEDEIALMTRWLRERDQPVPDESHMQTMQMPGMLTPAQLAQLDAARGNEFDRLFLTLMIQHHVGAVEMVEDLFASPGAAQDSDIFRFATDVGSDQLDEIGVMETLLDRMDPTARSDSR